jgi:5'-nucleotidase (lipoprotein e(P4) family)
MTSNTRPSDSTRLLSISALIVSISLNTIAVTGCRTATPPTPASTASAAAPALPDSVRWVRDAAEYRAAVLQTYRVATAAVTSASGGRAAGSWAIILDADETVISNLQHEIELAEKHQSFSAESWHAWVMRREATPLPGAAAFLARVRELGGRIAIVTNRLESECADTAAVFRAHQLIYDMMLCRPDKAPSDKNPRFTAVAAGTTTTGGPALEVLAFLGDNILDFPNLTQAAVKEDARLLELFGTKYFVVPNPMYGSWQ